MRNKQLNCRHELKYICSEADLQVIEAKMKLLCPLDQNSNEGGSYHIRSVYFDTYDDAFLKENEAGVDNRKKYRIRIYNNSDALIKLECKKTIHGTKSKESCTLTKQQCEALLRREYHVTCNEKQELLAIFQMEARQKIYLPKVIVDYDRSAYVYPVGNVRITFDRNIYSSNAIEDFFQESIIRRPIMPTGKQILEVKYDEVLPDFFWRLIPCRSNSQRSSFSKYYLCRTHCL